MVERRSKEEVEEVVVAEEPLTVAQTGPDRGKLLPPEVRDGTGRRVWLAALLLRWNPISTEAGV